MRHPMYTGSEAFFAWLDYEDAYCEITYMPACGELEIKVSILGEGDFYQKRAGTFEMFLANAKKLLLILVALGHC